MSSNGHFVPNGPLAPPQQVPTIRLVSFPQNVSIKIRVGRGQYIPLRAEPMPALTTERNYAVAVLENNGMVRGLYNPRYRRFKFDILTNIFRQMGTNECREFPTDYACEHSSANVCLIPHIHSNPWRLH